MAPQWLRARRRGARQETNYHPKYKSQRSTRSAGFFGADPGLLVQDQRERRAIGLEELDRSRAALSGAAAEQNELRGIAPAIDEVREQALRR